MCVNDFKTTAIRNSGDSYEQFICNVIAQVPAEHPEVVVRPVQQRDVFPNLSARRAHHLRTTLPLEHKGIEVAWLIKNFARFMTAKDMV